MLKRLFIFQLLLLCVVCGYSQNYSQREASLNIFSNEAPFILFINNIAYNSSPLAQIRVDKLPDYLYDIRVEFDSRQGTSVSTPGLAVYNELGQPLDITLMAVKQRQSRNSLIIFSLFPTYMSSPDVRSYTIYSFNKPDKLMPNRPNYNGIEGMNEAEFQSFLASLKRGGFDDDKVKSAVTVTKNTALSVNQISQAMKAFSWDDGKISFAQLAFENSLDKVNYLSLIKLLTFSDAKDKLISFVKTRSVEEKYLDQMHSEELDDFLKIVKSQGFDDGKTKIISAISAMVSFNVSEVKLILDQYSFDEEKLKGAKILFTNCSDKKNYYTVVDELTFSSNKKELQDFINAKK